MSSCDQLSNSEELQEDEELDDELHTPKKMYSWDRLSNFEELQKDEELNDKLFEIGRDIPQLLNRLKAANKIKSLVQKAILISNIKSSHDQIILVHKVSSSGSFALSITNLIEPNQTMTWDQELICTRRRYCTDPPQYGYNLHVLCKIGFSEIKKSDPKHISTEENKPLCKDKVIMFSDKSEEQNVSQQSLERFCSFLQEKQKKHHHLPADIWLLMRALACLVLSTSVHNYSNEGNKGNRG